MDKYDRAIEALLMLPEEDFSAAVDRAWDVPTHHYEGVLFLCVSPSGTARNRPSDGKRCGCLTQIRKQEYDIAVAWTDELTEAIRSDDRIPRNPEDIRPEHLPVFAEWQRRLDKEIRNEGSNRNG